MSQKAIKILTEESIGINGKIYKGLKDKIIKIEEKSNDIFISFALAKTFVECGFAEFCDVSESEAKNTTTKAKNISKSNENRNTVDTE